jgi:hypothetical protein
MGATSNRAPIIVNPVNIRFIFFPSLYFEIVYSY